MKTQCVTTNPQVYAQDSADLIKNPESPTKRKVESVAQSSLELNRTANGPDLSALVALQTKFDLDMAYIKSRRGNSSLPLDGDQIKGQPNTASLTKSIEELQAKFDQDMAYIKSR